MNISPLERNFIACVQLLSIARNILLPTLLRDCFSEPKREDEGLEMKEQGEEEESTKPAKKKPSKVYIPECT